MFNVCGVMVVCCEEEGGGGVIRSSGELFIGGLLYTDLGFGEGLGMRLMF